MKNSGFAWLGDIPAEWSLNRIGSLFTHRKEIVSDKEYAALSVTKKGILPQLKTAAKTNDGDNRKKVLKGDFVINSRSDRRGSSGLSELDGSVSLINTVLSRSKLNPRYTHYLLRSYPFQQEFYRWGQGIVADLWSTNYQRMKSIILPSPPQNDQQRIADFLDKETAKIDNLIAKQERLLELIEERRRTIITNTVTDGLNPTADIQDVNNQWIAKIPKHWRLQRIKDIFTINNEALGRNTASHMEFEYVDISSVDKYKGIIKRESMIFERAPSRARRIVRQGDIIVATVRTYLEAIAQIDITNEKFIVSTGFAVLRPKETESSDFFYFALRSSAFMANVVANSNGVSYPGINIDKLASLPIPTPPKGEQKEIASFLKDQNAKFNSIKSKVNTYILFLKEYRASLISHTVTGKMKA